MLRYLLSLLLITFSVALFAQENEATINGKVTDSTGAPLSYVNVVLEANQGIGTNTNEKGEFSLKIPEGKQVLIVSSFTINTVYKEIKVKAGENYQVNIKVGANAITWGITNISAKKARPTVSTIEYEPTETMVDPSGHLESQLQYTALSFNKIGGENSSAYSVRGGSFDENLIYINDFEVYRPYMVRSGEQEGLSFANPSLVKRINFSSGGFEARYGDKMASVMDINYKQPQKWAGSITGSLLGATAHLQGCSKDTSLTLIFGFRQKSNQYLLNSLQTKGEYSPAFYDFQTYLTYKFKQKHELEFISNYAYNIYKLQPVDRQTDFGLINKVVRLNMYFEGAERDVYHTFMGGLAYNFNPIPELKLRLLASYYHTAEREAYDILGEYWLGEVETDFTKANFNEVKYSLGTGAIHNWARNELYSDVYNLKHIGSYYFKPNHAISWGISYKHEKVQDAISEWQRIDSAGYSIPYSEDYVYLKYALKSDFNLESNRYETFVQDKIDFGQNTKYSFTGGLRLHFWDVNKELLASPRAQFAVKPAMKNKKREFTFYLAGGMYQQAPFYREMRNLQGDVNLNLKAQKSVHAVAGYDLDFTAWRRPFRFTTEAYYKYLWDLVPYELDNVLIRYTGKNNAVGYAYGIDLRLNGELVEGEESWVSLSLLNTREDILDDHYTEYYDENGAVTYKGALNANPIVDSTEIYPKYLPRPTDQRVKFALFFQDHIPKLEVLKVHVNLLYATGLPYGPPDGERYQDILRIQSYKRVDMGFSAQLYDHNWQKVKKGTFNKIFKSIWFDFEVFNILGINNTVSYLWIEDFQNNEYAVPNYLTSRRFNGRLVVKF